MKLLPLREMAENFGLVRKSMRSKLLEQLNGNIHYQIFCDVIIDPTRPLTNYKLLDNIMMALARVMATD